MAKFVRMMFYSILSIFGGLLGYKIAEYLQGIYKELQGSPLNFWSFVLVGMLVGVAVAPLASNLFLRIIDSVILGMKKVSLQEIIMGSIGLIFGLLVSTLMNLALGSIPFEKISVIGELIKPFLYLVVTIFWGYLGIFFATRMMFIQSFGQLFNSGSGSGSRSTFNWNRNIKILDTSAIVDGRILDISKSGFLQGTLVVPQFVLNELQQIADSADSLKRNRGRRGLDVLHNLQKDPGIQIPDKDFDEMGVDGKLIKLAQEMNAQLVTTDFNLNKVAQLQGLKVLNINELANAVKQVLLPGEQIEVSIIKEGKESSQGVAYLEDGTMIVVEDGKRSIGEKVQIEVTSVIQTVAGKMIFGRQKRDHHRR